MKANGQTAETLDHTEYGRRVVVAATVEPDFASQAPLRLWPGLDLLEREQRQQYLFPGGKPGHPAGPPEQAAGSQDKVNRSMREGRSAASGLESRLKSVVKAYLGVSAAQAFVAASNSDSGLMWRKSDPPE